MDDELIKRVGSVSGIYECYEDEGEKYVEFVRIDNVMDEKDWNVFEFLDGELEGVGWCNGLGEGSEMYNDKGMERYNK